jgi:hypothetical protein
MAAGLSQPYAATFIRLSPAFQKGEMASCGDTPRTNGAAVLGDITLKKDVLPEMTDRAFGSERKHHAPS